MRKVPSDAYQITGVCILTASNNVCHNLCPSCSLTVINDNLGDKEKLYLTLTPSVLQVSYTFLMFFDGFICLYLPLVLRIFSSQYPYIERTRFHLSYVSHALMVPSPDPKFIVSLTQRGHASIYPMYHMFSRCCPQTLTSETRSHYVVQADSNAGLQLSSHLRHFQGVGTTVPGSCSSQRNINIKPNTAVGKHYFCYFLMESFCLFS